MFLSSHTNLKSSSFNKVATSMCYSLYSGEQTGISLRQKQPPRGVLGKDVLKICSKFTEEHPCRTARNRTSAWVFSCKFAAYFQNTFS